MSKISISEQEREHILRELLFVPCDSKEHLDIWVKTFLKIELPSGTVCDTDDFNPSNSNPLDILWEMYDALRRGDQSKTYFLYYAARGTYKSVVASVLECLCLFHLRKDVAHIAAQLSQSKVVQRYLAAYLKMPFLSDYMTSKNSSEISVAWYEKDGKRITPTQHKALVEDERPTWKERTYQVTVVVATLSGTNSLHVPVTIMDELDLTPAQVISEAMMIPTPDKETGAPPVVAMTSSRKFAMGPVQEAIDTAEKTGLTVRHWNIIDVTSACPSSRHLPELPKIPVYYSNDDLHTIGEEEYNALPEENRKPYQKDEAYQGCIKNCKMFAMCRGRLATKQPSKSNMLRTPEFTQDTFLKMTDVEKAHAQLLCWAPSKHGLIYPKLNKDVHLITAANAYSIVTGDAPPGIMGRQDFLKWLETQEVTYHAGLDHGYNHCFAGIIGVKIGRRFFIIDSFAVPGLELDGKVQLVQSRFGKYDPVVFADTSHPGDNETIKKKTGLRLRKWSKGPSSVVDGIGIVRMKISPIGGSPELYFISGDPNVEAAFDLMLKYHWVIDPVSGEPTDQPSEENDDILDALRYCVMNTFSQKGKEPIVAQAIPAASAVKENIGIQQLHWQQMLRQAGVEDVRGTTVVSADDSDKQLKKKRKSIVWDI